MPPHALRTRPPRRLVRTFSTARLAAAALAFSYERLLPEVRRPLPPLPAPNPATLPRPRRRGSGQAG